MQVYYIQFLVAEGSTLISAYFETFYSISDSWLVLVIAQITGNLLNTLPVRLRKLYWLCTACLC